MRSHGDYCSEILNPLYSNKDTNVLEGVQWEAVKLVDRMANLWYDDRPKCANLIYLDKMRDNSDSQSEIGNWQWLYVY